MNERPRHIAFIMDGNGRWAEQLGLPRIEGHRRGAETVRMVSETCTEWGIEALTLYCLSSENWKRPESEVQFLMQLLQEYLVGERQIIMDQGMRLTVIGRRDRLPAEVIAEMEETERLSAANPGTQLILAIDYGGRGEIVEATRQLARRVGNGELEPEAIDETTFANTLYTRAIPDPDLLIRTGGEHRVSNFLLWQISYAELWFTPKYWPEFSREDLEQAVADFARRSRRYGGLTSR
ncbi:polyprenyl diphosphate synthase [Candidatus Laterigemmans baculatus]|uniref:polyprenyl diphosphate synthase n=1 Tax=Candidatus Laterigemmans baculatus TaxID=2770505 RepID=UPI0021BCAC05|nr:polyprenyl diphosphate synthase [Candidatus Laterigemmans baculatus]